MKHDEAAKATQAFLRAKSVWAIITGLEEMQEGYRIKCPELLACGCGKILNGINTAQISGELPAVLSSLSEMAGDE